MSTLFNLSLGLDLDSAANDHKCSASVERHSS
jgi:hypothetical protein